MMPPGPVFTGINKGILGKGEFLSCPKGIIMGLKLLLKSDFGMS